MCNQNVITKWLIIGWVFFSLPVLANDKSDMSSIQFTLDDTNLSHLTFDVPTQKVNTQVSENLTQWRFPVSASSQHPTHTLTAMVGKVSNQATPTGFSFSSGNSDPRSVDFQKADVLPISCQLKKSPSDVIEFENKMTFTAYQTTDDFSKEKAVEKLIDQISTTCFNLLDDHKVPKVGKKTESDTTFKPTWMPDIQIEVKQKNTTLPAKKLGVENSGSPKGQSENTQATTPESEEEEGTKELIIHNQGTPLTINFGHERH
jgi:hypothetical protein